MEDGEMRDEDEDWRKEDKEKWKVSGEGAQSLQNGKIEWQKQIW